MAIAALVRCFELNSIFIGRCDPIAAALKVCVRLPSFSIASWAVLGPAIGGAEALAAADAYFTSTEA